jgi:hypothetical protein
MTQADRIQGQIDQLIPKAETGEQWAEVCRLEAELIALRGQAKHAQDGMLLCAEAGPAPFGRCDKPISIWDTMVPWGINRSPLGPKS